MCVLIALFPHGYTGIQAVAEGVLEYEHISPDSGSVALAMDSSFTTLPVP
jgi:hypothetical protein